MKLRRKTVFYSCKTPEQEIYDFRIDMHALAKFITLSNLPSNISPFLSFSLSFFLSICQYDIFIYIYIYIYIYICMPLCMLPCINVNICQYWNKKNMFESKRYFRAIGLSFGNIDISWLETLSRSEPKVRQLILLSRNFGSKEVTESYKRKCVDYLKLLKYNSLICLLSLFLAYRQQGIL